MMKQRLIQIFLFSAGFLSVNVCSSHEYILIREYKTWDEAQDYCRQNYSDLATVQTDEEWSQLNTLRAELQFKTWIGLYDDVNSWRWSFQNESITFMKWDVHQPDNFGGNQNCVVLHSSGYWHDKSCSFKSVIICQSNGQPVLVNGSLMSWNNAQSYCRENYEDLFTVENNDENQQLTMMTQNYTWAWIGLFRDSWKWSDQTITNPLRWAPGQPDNSFGSEICAAVDSDGQIADETCSKQFFFFCNVRLKQQILRLEVKAGDNVNDPEIRDAVMEEVHQKLREQGMAADVKLVWREQPDGIVFQKIKDLYK